MILDKTRLGPASNKASRRPVIAIEHQSMETVAQAAEILKGRAPKGAVNTQHWTRKELLNA